MEFEKGTVVISKAGRDKGYFMVVLDEADGYTIVADGKERPLERPKRKNPKHLQKTNKRLSLEQLTNKKLRTVLRSYSQSSAEESGE